MTRPVSTQKYNLAMSMVNSGMSDSEINRATGIHRDAVRRYRLGINVPSTHSVNQTASKKIHFNDGLRIGLSSCGVRCASDAMTMIMSDVTCRSCNRGLSLKPKVNGCMSIKLNVDGSMEFANANIDDALRIASALGKKADHSACQQDIAKFKATIDAMSVRETKFVDERKDLRNRINEIGIERDRYKRKIKELECECDRLITALRTLNERAALPQNPCGG